MNPGSITLKTFEAQDFMYIFKSFHGTPSVFDRLMKCYNGCNAILIKSCKEMEVSYIDYVSNQLKRPVLLIGPVVPEPHTGELDNKWANWLSQFGSKSVIYCSFGSETFLTDDRIKELALGLELTGLPFFLVLNFPANAGSSTELERTLPHGSVIEGLVNDCQLVMLPLKGDQLLNSKLMAMEWRVGVEVNRRDEDGYFGKEDVFEAVKSVMYEVDKEPAKSVRENHKKWKDFMQNNEIQSKYITDLIEKLQSLSHKTIY
uniref:UDP rhamnose:anthocyanidin-3-glucoside rhamnosyltransferase n=1 Tax=Tanacetum cinerariifolium TaxID=118510 RepID=A0A6L2MRN9_TANCI|nr:UDP rhamnose:anthocyanidin-3-glucoside rhamnosyltransferase [Tanacetum cinerariifolium]